MLGLIRRSLSGLFDFPPIKLFPSLSSLSPDDALRDLDFDIYEYDEKRYDYPLPQATEFVSVTSYDWAFSFRESAKSEKKVVLEVSVERLPKEPISTTYETCCLPVSPALTPTNTGGTMTLLRGGTSSTARTSTYETADLISEEEQNMILAAILASQEGDFDRQIPRHIREEMEHAEYIAALEESKEFASQAGRLASTAAAPPSPPPAAPARAATFASPSRGRHSPSSSVSTPRSLTRSNTDIPWTEKPGEHVEGESEKQRRFRELMQFHAVAAASIANASARTGVSNITGNEDASDYDWVGGP